MTNCKHCTHFHYDPYGSWDGSVPSGWCDLERPLEPCDDFEREVGADDDRGDDG